MKTSNSFKSFSIRIRNQFFKNILSVKVWIGVAIFTLASFSFYFALDRLQEIITQTVLPSLEQEEASIIIAYMQNIKELTISFFQLLVSAGLGLAGIRETMKAIKVNKGSNDETPL